MWVVNGEWWGFLGLVTAIGSRKLRVAKRLGPLFDLALWRFDVRCVPQGPQNFKVPTAGVSVSMPCICIHMCVGQLVVCLWCNFLNALPNGQTGKTLVQRQEQLKRWMMKRGRGPAESAADEIKGNSKSHHAFRHTTKSRQTPRNEIKQNQPHLALGCHLKQHL